MTSYDDCPYKFFLRYIKDKKEEPMFFSSYGSLVHEILEGFYNGEIPRDEMLMTFLTEYKSKIQGVRPQETTVQKYINDAINYLSKFEPVPYKALGVEKKVKFEIGGFPMIGYIDLLCEDENGNIIIIDNKSKTLSPRSKKSKPTKNDLDLDKMLKQLYLYSVPVEKEYGKKPKLLCFNCFRNGNFIEEPFDEDAYERVQQWAIDLINKLLLVEDFEGTPEFFKCRNICGLHNKCKYYLEKRE